MYVYIYIKTQIIIRMSLTYFQYRLISCALRAMPVLAQHKGGPSKGGPSKGGPSKVGLVKSIIFMDDQLSMHTNH